MPLEHRTDADASQDCILQLMHFRCVIFIVIVETHAVKQTMNNIEQNLMLDQVFTLGALSVRFIKANKDFCFNFGRFTNKNRFVSLKFQCL